MNPIRRLSMLKRWHWLGFENVDGREPGLPATSVEPAGRRKHGFDWLDAAALSRPFGPATPR